MRAFRVRNLRYWSLCAQEIARQQNQFIFVRQNRNSHHFRAIVILNGQNQNLVIDIILLGHHAIISSPHRPYAVIIPAVIARSPERYAKNYANSKTTKTNLIHLTTYYFASNENESKFNLIFSKCSSSNWLYDFIEINRN